MENMETVQNTEPTWADAAAASATAEERAAQLAMPPRRFDEMLPCSLTDEELRERGDELVKVLDTIDEIEAEKKSANDAFKARIQIQESRARELRTAIESKKEDRSVEVIESFELRLGVARTTRTDTGEQIRERALRQSELQPSLPAVDDSPQMNLADAALDETGEGEAVNADVDSETDITDPQEVLDAERPSDEDVAAKPKRSRKAKA